MRPPFGHHSWIGDGLSDLSFYSKRDGGVRNDIVRGASLYLWTRTSKERSRATRTSIRVMIPCEVLPLQWRGRCARWCRCECITDGGGVDAIGLQKSLCVRLQLF
ncbi:uncharacterized protein [Physcomitrium patens]|uniref:uncharacterized protein isoform X1 n=1 Tax=Physcomitrium patens TaxID=3218 RepID=UPI003CCD8C3E